MHDAPPIGHNGPPADEIDYSNPNWLKSFEVRANLPPDLPTMHFFKCDIKALYNALLQMPMEQRGFYMTALLAMYDRMEPLPADDPKQRQPDIRKAKAVLDWEPKVDLATGLGLTVEYFRNARPQAPEEPTPQ